MRTKNAFGGPCRELSGWLAGQPEGGALVLSPHADDAILGSLGAMLLLGRRRPPTVATIASADGDPRDTGYTATRRAEDRTAIAAAGGELVQLGFADAIYRRDRATGRRLYPDTASLFAGAVAGDRPHIRSLAGALGRLADRIGPALVFAPLAVGAHVDHLIAARLSQGLRWRRQALVFYEDFPYLVGRRCPGPRFLNTVRMFGSTDPLEAIRALGCRPLRRLTATVNWLVKYRLIRLYATQLVPLFGGASGLEKLLCRLSTGGKLTESYWLVESPGL